MIEHPRDNAELREHRDGRGRGPRLMLSHDGDCSELTQDECAVLAASARGLVSYEVAELLGVPSETTRRLLTSTMQKLGARSKLEAVIIALRNGLIDLPDA